MIIMMLLFFVLCHQVFIVFPSLNLKGYQEIFSNDSLYQSTAVSASEPNDQEDPAKQQEIWSSNQTETKNSTHPQNSIKELILTPPTPEEAKQESKEQEDGEKLQVVDRNLTLNATLDSAYEQPRPHPHAGARFPDGKFGYIADVFAVKRRYFELYKNENSSFLPMTDEEYKSVCETEPGEGVERSAGGWTLLKEKVQVDGPTPIASENATNNTAQAIVVQQQATTAQEKNHTKPRILCAIYTYEKNHHIVESIIDTWAWRCDGFFAGSTMTDETIGTVDIAHQGPEAYENMWQKVRSIWSYIHDNYVDDFDYFWIGGDDLVLIVENLRNYLATVHQPDGVDGPIYLGHQIPSFRETYFAGGGPGYVMNSAALKRIVTEGFPKCAVSQKSQY